MSIPPHTLNSPNFEDDYEVVHANIDFSMPSSIRDVLPPMHSSQIILTKSVLAEDSVKESSHSNRPSVPVTTPVVESVYPVDSLQQQADLTLVNFPVETKFMNQSVMSSSLSSDSSNPTMNNVMMSLSDMTKQLETVKNTLVSMDIPTNSVKESDYLELKESYERIEKQLSAKDSEVYDLKRKIEEFKRTLQMNVEDAKKREAEKNEIVAQLRSQMDAMKDSIRGLQEQVQAAQLGEDSAKMNLELIRSESSRLTAENEGLKTKLEEVNEEYHRYHMESVAKFEQVKKANDQLLQQQHQPAHDFEHVLVRSPNFEDEKEKMERMQSELRQVIYTEVQQHVEEEKAKLLGDLQSTTARMIQLSEENVELHRQLRSAGYGGSSNVELESQLMRQASDYRVQNDNLQQRILVLEKQLENAKEETDNKQAIIALMHEDGQEARRQLAEQRSDIDRLRANMSRAGAHHF